VVTPIYITATEIEDRKKNPYKYMSEYQRMRAKVIHYKWGKFRRIMLRHTVTKLLEIKKK